MIKFRNVYEKYVHNCTKIYENIRYSNLKFSNNN